MRNYTVPPIPKSVWRNPLHFIAFGFGTGALPIAPGTFGTLVAIPIYLLLHLLTLQFYLGVTLLIMLASMWICERVSNDIGVRDHQGMCLDEIAGFLFAMIGVPFGWGWIAAAFILFRIFDIVKPWPINWLDQNIHGGVGMILDDVAAGIASCLILLCVHHLSLLQMIKTA